MKKSCLIWVVIFFYIAGPTDASVITAISKAIQKAISKEDDSLIKSFFRGSRDDIKDGVATEVSRSGVKPRNLSLNELRLSVGRTKQRLKGIAPKDIFESYGERMYPKNEILFDTFDPLDDQTPKVSTKKEFFNFESQMLRVRHQGNNGSCTAFAVVSAMEMLALRKYGRQLDLSEQSLWMSQDQMPNLEAAIVSALSYPVNREIFDPYWGSVSIEGGDKKKFIYGVRLDPHRISKLTQYAQIADALVQGDAVIIALNRVSRSFHHASEKSPIVADEAIGQAGHVMGLSGMILDPGFPGGGYFIVRNSYGRLWGVDGYGAIDFNYCKIHGCQFVKFSKLVFQTADEMIIDKNDNLRELNSVIQNFPKTFQQYVQKFLVLFDSGKLFSYQKLALSNKTWQRERHDVSLEYVLPEFISDESNAFLKKAVNNGLQKKIVNDR